MARSWTRRRGRTHDYQPRTRQHDRPLHRAGWTKFRDLDGDGVLSPFEDWRLPAVERARDLVSRMTTEEKAGLMVIGLHYPGYSAFLPNPVEGQILNQEDVWRDANPITGVPFAEPVLVTSATGKAINERGQRYFVVRDNLTPRSSPSGPTRSRNCGELAAKHPGGLRLQPAEPRGARVPVRRE